MPEQISQEEKALRVFFDTLPDTNSEGPHVISRERIDTLIEDGITTEELFREFVRRGYLLHGTGSGDIKILEPRQARCESGAPENVQYAVYASDDPRVSLFMALVRNLPPPAISRYGITVSVGDDGVETETTVFESSRDIPENTEGSMYILSQDSFESAGKGQFTSQASVIPAYVIPVHRPDFAYPIQKIEVLGM